MLAEKGHVCKIRNIFCCFFIPNIYAIIIRYYWNAQCYPLPHMANNSWFACFSSLGGDWTLWLITGCISKAVFIILFCIFGFWLLHCPQFIFPTLLLPWLIMSIINNCSQEALKGESANCIVIDLMTRIIN